MNSKIVNKKVTDWTSDSQFIEITENKANYLVETFPLNRVEALTIAIVEEFCNRNTIATKKKISDILSDQFELELTETDLKSIECMFDIIATGKTRITNISSPWLSYLYEDVAFSSEIMEDLCVPDCKDIADFYEIDSRVISLIKHAISSKSPIKILIDDCLQGMSIGIVKHLLEKEGIYCLIASIPSSSDVGIYAMQAIQAMHLGGIVLFQECTDSVMDKFINMAQVFGFRYGMLKTTELELKNIRTDGDTSDDEGVPFIEYVPVINLHLKQVSGEVLRKKASEYFSDDPEFLRLIISSRTNIATICHSRTLIKEIVATQDWGALSKYLEDTQKADISEDTRKRRQVNSDQYDVKIINSDIPIDILDRMAEKAFKQHSPWKLLLAGDSGTGKSAYAYHLAEKLGIDVIVKRPQDVIFRFFGESETAIANAFREAESKNAILLFDEADGYLSRKSTNILSSGDKGYNDITNAFMINLEEYSGLVIATTNYPEVIEPAIIRRFHKTVEFKFPTYEGMKHLFTKYFPDMAFEKRELERICTLGTIGPGDFVAVRNFVIIWRVKM